MDSNIFKIGDQVEIVYNDNGSDSYVGHVGNIRHIDNEETHPYAISGCPMTWAAEEIRLYKEGLVSQNDKYYLSKNDCPLFKKGAILLKKTGETIYRPISDLWTVVEGTEEYGYVADVVEKNPDWFERVYNVGKGDKKVFATKDKARELSSSMFEVQK